MDVAMITIMHDCNNRSRMFVVSLVPPQLVCCVHHYLLVTVTTLHYSHHTCIQGLYRDLNLEGALGVRLEVKMHEIYLLWNSC